MTLNLDKFWEDEFEEHAMLVVATKDKLKSAFCELVDECMTSIAAGGKILLFGNGGSAADAQHLATEFTVRYKTNRRPIRAIALTTDTSALTAIGNDLGFQCLFERQIEALGDDGDIAIGISTSGTSANVLLGLKEARKRGMVTAGLTGKTGGNMGDHCDILLNVPSETTARIQEMHIMLGQMLCGALEARLGLIGERAA